MQWRLWKFLTNPVKHIRVCVSWQRRGSVTGHMAAGGVGVGVVLRRPGEDMTGWKKTSTALQDENSGWQKDSRRNPVKQSVLLFTAQTRHIALTHQVFLFVGTPRQKLFLSSFRREEGSKLTLSAEHGVSASSVYSHKKHISDSGTIISYSDIYCIYWDLSYAFFKIWYWKLIRRSS